MKRLVLFFALVSFFGASAQVSDNFSDGDFAANPAWTGDTEAFEVLNGELHLKDVAAAGLTNEKYLATPSVAARNASWEFFVKFDASTNELSTGNYACIYLMADAENVKVSSKGFYVKVGGNGSGDAGKKVALYKVGSSTPIINGIDSRLKFHPTTIKVKVTRDENDLWTLSSDILDGNGYVVEGAVPDNAGFASHYFGIYCYYSSTRNTAFYFDDIVVTGEADNTPQAETPAEGDLIINEIMPDCKADSYDYIEIYNKSDKLLDLTGVRFVKTSVSNPTTQTIPAGTTIQPNGYAAFGADPENLRQTFSVPDEANIITLNLGTFLTNESATIQLTNGAIVFDELTYSSKWHSPLLTNTKGIALERINPNLPTQDASNWHSAASNVNYGTPGYRNSQYSTDTPSETGKKAWAEPENFTPDNDGIDDVTNIYFHTAESGYFATVSIYDALGRKVRTLANNLLISSDGFLRWDGTDDNGKVVNVGIYAVYAEIIRQDGKKEQFKFPCVVSAGKN